MPIQYTLGLLATTITEIVKTFPEANIALSEVDFALFSQWPTLVERGVTTA